MTSFRILRPLLISLSLALPSLALADDHSSSGSNTHHNGELRHQSGKPQVWHAETGQWTSPERFFELELIRLKGPTYGTRSGDNYPDYDSVEEWQTLVDKLPDGRICPMVFFHNRWRRLPDVLALDESLRNYDGCRDVFKF